jgi:hypothetical protein
MTDKPSWEYASIEEKDQDYELLHEEIIEDLNSFSQEIKSIDNKGDLELVERVADHLDDIIGVENYGLGEGVVQCRARTAFYSVLEKSEDYRINTEDFVSQEWEEGTAERLRVSDFEDKKQEYQSWKKEHTLTKIHQKIEKGPRKFLEEHVEVLN